MPYGAAAVDAQTHDHGGYFGLVARVAATNTGCSPLNNPAKFLIPISQDAAITGTTSTNQTTDTGTGKAFINCL